MNYCQKYFPEKQNILFWLKIGIFIHREGLHYSKRLFSVRSFNVIIMKTSFLRADISDVISCTNEISTNRANYVSSPYITSLLRPLHINNSINQANRTYEQGSTFLNNMIYLPFLNHSFFKMIISDLQ